MMVPPLGAALVQCSEECAFLTDASSTLLELDYQILIRHISQKTVA